MSTDIQPQPPLPEVRIGKISINKDDYDILYDDLCDDSDTSELSVRSRSPTPPPDFYPSPPPSQNLNPSPPSPNAERRVRDQEDDAPPAPKRRKVEPTPRITQYLDLTAGADSLGPGQRAQLDLLLTTLRNKRKIVVIAGAGISVSSGIPDFRSTDGLFSSLKKDHKLKTSGKALFDASVYHDDSTTSSFHDMVRSLSSLAASAQPSAFHHLLARLSHTNRLLRLYTQNVDGIDTSLPPLATQVPLGVKAPWPRTIQLHGGLEKMVCQKCRHTSDFKAELFEGPNPPLCDECSTTDEVRKQVGRRSHGVGKLRPRIVLYNEHNPDEDAIGSVVTADLRTRPDALIVVGTSLKIPSVRRIVREMSRAVRSRKNGVTMWVNQDSLPVGKEFQDCWDLVIKGECDQVARHVGLKNWDDQTEDVFDECPASTPSSQQSADSTTTVTTPKKQQKLSDTGMLTPSSSQDETSSKPKNAPSKQGPKPKTSASKGRTTSTVDKAKKRAEPNAKKVMSNKNKGPPAKRGRPPKNQPKISQQLPATKPNTTTTSKILVQDCKVEPSKPMQTVPPSAARNNGPAPAAPSDHSSFDCQPRKDIKDLAKLSPVGTSPALQP
ncbi:hypothetical protein FQN54_007141 [Arachnomyces sp. PD_36]|nr:hypothetical protein FQN54_007141 [Arachnomyces sp. PD_36]